MSHNLKLKKLKFDYNLQWSSFLFLELTLSTETPKFSVNVNLVYTRHEAMSLVSSGGLSEVYSTALWKTAF